MYQNKNKIKIAHDTIPELMMPMQMDFYVTDIKEFDNIKLVIKDGVIVKDIR